MDKGAFIMHRIPGSNADINSEATRSVSKMEATISHRPVLKTVVGKYCAADTDSDGRFCSLFQRMESGEWKARYVKHWYEKDKLIPIIPNLVPELDERELQRFSVGNRYLTCCREGTTDGVKVSTDMS